MKFFKVIFFLIFSYCLVKGQSDEYLLKGHIVDDKKQDLPFASVSIANTNKGTSANDKGEFVLKLNKGSYILIVQYLGFRKKEVQIQINQNQEIEIMMYPEEISLKEVNIRAGEDPAYEVIRNAIKKRKQHNSELNSKSYQCDVYIKGVQKLDSIPEKLMGMKVQVNDNSKGIIYLSETKSTYYFMPPDRKKEIIKASRVSGESRGFSFNRYIPMQKNMYDNVLDFYFISSRPFISPINDNALLFYRYKLQGTFFEDGKMINKIEVIPKSNTEPCFRGFIYIEENSWRVHSYDLYITKQAKLNFIDTLFLKQLNTKVNDSLYFPVSIQYIFNFNFFGIKGSGYFIASVSDYVFAIDTLKNNFFQNEMVRFEKNAVNNDTSFWSNVRPIPLSEEEKKDYIKKDSIERVKNSPAYLDSMDRAKNKLSILKVFTGYQYQNSKSKCYFDIDGLLDAGIQFNTIEGANISLKTSLQKMNKENENKKWKWNNAFRYGFSNQLFGFKTELKYDDNPFNFRNYRLSITYHVEPYNHQYSIPELINTFYTLFDYRNYLKLYLNKAIHIFYHQEIMNGLYFTISATAQERVALQNQIQMDIFKNKNHYTSNNPLNPMNDNIAFVTHKAFLIHAQIKYSFKQKYTTYPDQKYVWKNKHPIITLEYNKALPLNSSMVDYDEIKLKLKGNIELNYFGDFKFEVCGGQFINNRKMYFMDYEHFYGNQTIVLNDWNSFRMLDYYRYSTNQYFIQSHAEYNLRGWVIGKLPLIRKLKVEEVITMHYLYNPLLHHYFEASFGIDKIFYFFRVEYALAYYPFYPQPIGQFLIGFDFLSKNNK
ncbi:MAG: DUF5686 and carboxypeptidase regulatory-like domain-containing protein [Bacteroidia bacterium]|nr:DUF5686 and carboxypeptidase regulatory-like domain-containing protein [Bacteroidia bacterium]